MLFKATIILYWVISWTESFKHDFDFLGNWIVNFVPCLAFGGFNCFLVVIACQVIVKDGNTTLWPSLHKELHCNKEDTVAGSLVADLFLEALSPQITLVAPRTGVIIFAVWVSQFDEGVRNFALIVLQIDDVQQAVLMTCVEIVSWITR